MGLPFSTLSGHCCGSRMDKITNEASRDLMREPTVPEAPVSGNIKGSRNMPEPSRRPQTKNGFLMKIGKSCCCSTLGDKVQPEGDARKPQIVSTSTSVDEPEGEPGTPKAIELAAACRGNKHSNFNGKWVLTHIEGNMDRLLTESGKGWFQRTSMQNANYGIGFVELHCKQDGDHFSLEKKASTGTWALNEFTVGVETSGMDDLGPMRFQAEWDPTGALNIDAVLIANQFHFGSKWFRDNPKERSETITSQNGTSVKQVFKLMHN